MRRVRIDAEAISADPRSRHRRTLDPGQLALAIQGTATHAYAVSFIVTNIPTYDETEKGETVREVEAWFRRRTDIEDRIREAKLGAALRKLPSGSAAVNTVWMWAALLSPDTLAQLATDREEGVSLALLERDDMPAEATAQVVETLLLAGVLDQHAMHVALKRPDFPDRLVETVVMRMAGHGTAARIDLARAIHEAPPYRRDAVHLQLLRGARRIRSTAELIDAVVGQDEGRVSWLAGRPDWKLQSLMAWRNELRGAEVETQEAADLTIEPPI